MHNIKIGNRIYQAADGELLSQVLQKNGLAMPHPCGGAGICGKCKLIVDGREELSCKYAVHGDISVVLPNAEEHKASPSAAPITANADELCYALDIGTTTLALALVSLTENRVLATRTRQNPQRAFGADIMSRIAYCQSHPQSDLRNAILPALEEMIAEFALPFSLPLFVSANVTMLHLLFGEDCRGIGVAPYTPVFLEARTDASFLRGVTEIHALPSLHAFVGADVVAGMYASGLPEEGKYRLLVDLGTNAEIVLYSNQRILCTAAAAGPCFEGVGISAGMSATDGAIRKVTVQNGALHFDTVGNAPPVGLCATGLIDLVACLLARGVIDESGLMEDDELPLANGVSFTASDVRSLQLAKSAVSAAILSLLHLEGISFDAIDTLVLSGGFSDALDVKNAAAIGLIPTELASKAESIGNSALSGTVKFAVEHGDLTPYTKGAEYVDLAKNKVFSDLFIENMMF